MKKAYSFSGDMVLFSRYSAHPRSRVYYDGQCISRYYENAETDALTCLLRNVPLPDLCEYASVIISIFAVSRNPQ